MLKASICQGKVIISAFNLVSALTKS